MMKTIFLFCFTLFALICFSQKDSNNLNIKVRLIYADPPTPPCGTIAWAVTHKAEIIESNIDGLRTKDTILLIQPCPEKFKTGYIQTGSSYNVAINKTSGANFKYTVVSQFLKEDHPQYWIRTIAAIK